MKKQPYFCTNDFSTEKKLDINRSAWRKDVNTHFRRIYWMSEQRKAQNYDVILYLLYNYSTAFQLQNRPAYSAKQHKRRFGTWRFLLFLVDINFLLLDVIFFNIHAVFQQNYLVAPKVMTLIYCCQSKTSCLSPLKILVTATLFWFTNYLLSCQSHDFRPLEIFRKFFISSGFLLYWQWFVLNSAENLYSWLGQKELFLKRRWSCSIHILVGLIQVAKRVCQEQTKLENFDPQIHLCTPYGINYKGFQYLCYRFEALESYLVV